MTTTSPTPTSPTGDLPEVPASIGEAARALRDGTLTSVDLVAACQARADGLDDVLGVYITRLDEVAVADAERADAELARGVDRGPLQGIPLGVKDIIAVAGSATTAQSLVLDGGWGEGWGDAPVVARLRAAGAIVVGKTSTMEFAVGMPDGTKPFPVPRNPWDVDRWPGGSSSGTGAGVAAGLFLGGLGTDTGGSVRIPAAFCGITGLKQTFGLVPKSGCVPLGYSLDHIGPMARTAADCAALIAVMAGPHPSDPTTVEPPAPMGPGAWPTELATGLDGMVIGVVRADHVDAPGFGDDALAAFEAAVETLVGLGAEVREVELPHYAVMRQVGMVTMRGESTSYHRSDLARIWDEYGVHTTKAVAMGSLVSGADYVQAQRVRRVVNAELGALFGSGIDAVVTPMAGMGAPLVEGLDHTSFIDWPVFSQYWNPTGLPALAVPMGFTDDPLPLPLPLSLQVAGPAWSEAALLTIGNAYQSVTDWHRRTPPPLAG